MKRRNPLALLGAWLTLALSPTPTVQAVAATESHLPAGQVTGRVRNAATDQYLVNARITVKGSGIQTFTDELGVFHLTGVPAGNVVLQVFFTGLNPLEISVHLPPGGSVNQSVSLTPLNYYGAQDGVVNLDPFAVTASNELSAEALAVNEQRFAPNIKSVLAADAFGDISEGNIGEFMKYMPGITADFADPDMVSISVRGLASNLTQVTSDGAQMASAHTGGSTRVFQFNQVSINNISRLELTKVPTPAHPADSLGGIVNLVSKSAFERQSSRLSYRFFLTASEKDLTTKKKLDGFDKERLRIMPSAEFTYTVPVNDKLGFVVSGISSNRFDERHVLSRSYNATLANSGASYSQPFLQSFTLQELPRYTTRNSGSLKMDWRVTPHSVLSIGGQYSGYQSTRAMNQLLVNVGGNAAPTPASGRRLEFGPDYTLGASGRGAVTMNGQFYKIRGATGAGNVRYRFDNGTWEIKLGASQSASRTRFTDTKDDTFYNTTTQLFNGAGFVGSVFTINFRNLTPDGRGDIEILNNQNQPVDWSDLRNYRMTAASSQPRYVKDKVETADLSVRRRVQRFYFPLDIEIGGAQRIQERDTRLEQHTFDYAGLDGLINTWESPLPYARTDNDREFAFGLSRIPWVSNTAAYKAWKANPTLFSQTVARQVAGEQYRIENSENIEETVSAGYVSVDLRLFNNRLRFLTGVRYERTVGKGLGALIEPNGVYVRNADGSFAHDASGNLIRKPEAGAAGSLAEVGQIYSERAARSRRTYDGYYPSAHLTYTFRENLLLRLAYAKTYGRPNFNQIIPRATINDFDVDEDADPDALLGTINMRNPALRPWTADNYDITLEYYTQDGGVYGVGGYRKEIDGFFQSVTKILTAEDVSELGLDPMYVGYRMTTPYNLNAGKAQGVEANMRQPLHRLGAWGRRFDFFANASFFKQISGLNGRNFNAGLTYRHRPFTIGTKVNHRTGSRGTAVAALGPDAYQYEGTRTTVDLSVSAALNRRVSLFINGSNIFNDHPSADRYGSETPAYAKFFRVQEFGAQYSAGIRGTF